MIDFPFYEIDFPSEIAYGVSGGPEFFTDITTSSSGFEQRNINWSSSRCCYNLAQSIKTKDQLDVLIAFFRLVKGRAIGFRFKDWSDYQIAKQKIAKPDGKTNIFQIVKEYEFYDRKISRKITKPVKDKVKVFCNQVLVFPNINYTTGEIIFDKPPDVRDEIIVDAEFDVPVRFDIDKLITSIESYGVYTHYEIPLVEIKI